jgi:ribose transport system substrate-binding protein
MNSMKPWKWLAIAAAFACAAPATTAFAQAKKRIALVQAHQESRFRIDLNAGATEEAKKLGVDLVIYNANNNPGLQNDAMETYVNDKVDAILVLAIDANGIKPSIADAVKAGIPVLAVDTVVDGANQANIGVDNKDVGRNLGRLVGEYINNELGGQAEIGVVGALNSFIQNLRLDGFKEGIAAVAPKAKIVGVVDGQNTQNVAQNVSEALLTANPKLSVIYATGEPAMVGAMASVLSQGAKDRVKIFGWDLNAQSVKAIDEGWVRVVAQQEAAVLGSTAVATAVKLLKGEKIEAKVSVPVSIVDKSNVDKFRGRFK